MPETGGCETGGGDGGPRAAFEAAHARLGPWVRRLLRERCGTGPEEDLSQAVWAAVWKAMESGAYDPGRAAISTFVFAVMQNTWRRWVRDRKLAGTLEPGEEGVDPQDPAAIASEADYLERVRDVLLPGGGGGIPDEARRILGLVAGGAGDREIARVLGCSPSTANARKREALAVLRGVLEGADSTRAPGNPAAITRRVQDAR